MKIAKAHTDRGFTLVETAIAMGMVALMITAFMVAFGPAVKSINKSISVKEASRLSSALELEMGVVRNGEIGPYANSGVYPSAMAKTYWWIRFCHSGANAVLVYQYRGDPANVRADGTLAPYYNAGNQYDPENPATPGQNYVIQTSVRKRDASNDTKIQAELYPGNLEGKVYYVKLLQLRPDADGKMVTPSNPWHVYTMQDPQTMTGDFIQYTEPVLAFQAQFYEVNPPLWSYIDNTFDTATLGKPVYTRNMAVSR